MKKLLLVLLALLMVFALPIIAFAESSGAVAVSVPVPVTLTDIITKAVIWLIGAVASIGSIVIWRWLYPLIRDSILPWLEDKNLLVFADAAVKYAEALLGRYNGEEKWNVALDWLNERGWNIDSESVVSALKAAWYSLNLDQLKAGIKKPEKITKPPERIEPPAE